MSNQIQKVSECKGDGWDTVCPICGDEIDHFTAPLNEYEIECKKCDRWYYLSDAVCKPVGVNMSQNEVRRGFLKIVMSEPMEVDVKTAGPNAPRTERVVNPVLKRMSETLDAGRSAVMGGSKTDD